MAVRTLLPLAGFQILEDFSLEYLRNNSSTPDIITLERRCPTKDLHREKITFPKRQKRGKYREPN